MEVALTAPRSLPSPRRCRRTMISQGPGHPGLYRWSLLSYSHHWKVTVKSSLKVPPTDHFGEPNKFTKYLHILSEILLKSLPEPVKEFPWKKAKELVLHHLFHLGKKAFKWFLVGFLFVSFASDASFSFSRNIELMIPLGLFIGITVADFLVETSKELTQSTTRENSFEELLLGIGTIFACIKLVTPYVALPGRMVLSHTSSGGLLQALCLAKELQGRENEKDVESPLSVHVESQEPVA